MIGDILDPFVGVYNTYSQFFNGFADYGTSQIADVIQTHGGNPSASSITFAIGILYLMAKMLPFIVAVYYVLRRFFRGKAVPLGISIVLKLATIGITAYVLNISPPPTHVFDRIAYGPDALITAFQNLFRNDPLQLFHVLTVFVVFIVLSYLLFFSIFVLIWAVGVMTMKTPPFSETSGKGLAALITVVWVFYISVMPGAMAFISTLVVVAMIGLRRTSYDYKKYVKSPAERVQRRQEIDEGVDREDRITWIRTGEDSD